MNRYLIYLAMAGVGIILQTVLIPTLLQGYFKPDLILILVVYLGLHEPPLKGGLLVYLLGWGYDTMAGVFPGLHGFVLLGIFLAVLLLLVTVGTALQSALVAFALDFFGRTVRIWPQIAWQLPVQMLINFIAAFVLLRLTVWLQKTFLPRTILPGLRKLDSRYEP